MKDESKTKTQLMEEIAALCRRVAELEAAEAERKRTEEGLRENEETLRALLNAIDDSALLVDPDGTVIIMNETTARRFGREAGELIGTDVFDLLPHDIAESRRAWIKKAIDTAKPVHFTDQRAGMHMEHSVFPIPGPSRQVERVAIFGRDVTDHVKMKEELFSRSQELEAFAHTISHDLNTPLAIIDGYARTAQNAIENGTSEVVEESLEGIIKATQRMEGFINALLEYAKAGHPEGKAVRVEPVEIVNEVIGEYAEHIKQIDAQIEVRGDLPPLMVDPARFRQAVANLLGNALKFMGNTPKPRVEIEARSAGGLVTWFIRDNGSGIPPEAQKNIFEPFRRFSATTSPGLGIGLSTVKRVVEAWGGEVWVESTRGEGSTFFFTVPAPESGDLRDSV